MVATLADVLNVIESLAPYDLAEKWDNIGLQVGQKEWPVRTIWVALDPLPDVVAAACEKNVDLIITHHPLIFKPLRSIDFGDPIGSIIQMAAQHQTAICAMHTNLDSAAGGTNDLLADKIGLNNLKILGKTLESENCMLVVYAPPTHEAAIVKALLDVGLERKTGRLGVSPCRSFSRKGFDASGAGSLPEAFAVQNQPSHPEEQIRIEAFIEKKELKRIIDRVGKTCPLDAFVYDVYPSATAEKKEGLGRIGELESPMKLSRFAKMIKEKLKIKTVKIAGKPDLMISKAALCTGSGSSLMDDFFSSDAQVYISGDLRYHDARAAEAVNLSLIDIGHFPSEHMVVGVLADRLNRVLYQAGIEANVEAYRLERDPFEIV